jgi:antitoxin VapB
MIKTAKVFNVGTTQVVLLPTGFHMDTREVWISQNEVTGQITIQPKESEADELRRQQEIETLLKMIENDSLDESTITTKPAP